MGLDSVELVLQTENSFGIKITNDEAECVRTPRQLVALVAKKLGVVVDGAGPCMTLRSFHVLRRALGPHAGLAGLKVTPASRVRDLVKGRHREAWATLRSLPGMGDLPAFWLGPPRTVGVLMSYLVSNAARHLKRPAEHWTQGQVRQVVRAIVSEISGLGEFSDDDNFVFDLKFD